MTQTKINGVVLSREHQNVTPISIPSYLLVFDTIDWAKHFLKRYKEDVKDAIAEADTDGELIYKAQVKVVEDWLKNPRHEPISVPPLYLRQKVTPFKVNDLEQYYRFVILKYGSFLNLNKVHPRKFDFILNIDSNVLYIEEHFRFIINHAGSIRVHSLSQSEMSEMIHNLCIIEPLQSAAGARHTKKLAPAH